MKVPRLKQVRERRFITQSVLAYKTGLSQSTIAHIETGMGARLSTITILAEVLEVAPSELVEEQS